MNSLNLINNKAELGHSLQLNRSVFSDVYNLKKELCWVITDCVYMDFPVIIRFCNYPVVLCAHLNVIFRFQKPGKHLSDCWETTWRTPGDRLGLSQVVATRTSSSWSDADTEF